MVLLFISHFVSVNICFMYLGASTVDASVQFSCSVMSSSVTPWLQHVRLLCPSKTLRACSNSGPEYMEDGRGIGQGDHFLPPPDSSKYHLNTEQIPQNNF